MSIKVYNPTTNARRGMSVTDYSELSKVAPEKSLLRPLKKNSGRPQKVSGSAGHCLRYSCDPRFRLSPSRSS